ncbi:MAG TPA: 5'-3' exonuclease H3TH domain-containing protein, partial [Planctomycetaceae bacterium]|nr:5'-3' exonuclease H3TH domain-containing protein [Planctomycetaceae bacterium]
MAGRNPEPAWNEAVQPAKEKHRPTATGGSTQRTTDAVPVDRCNVLAIDFLNILVRAFHAGAPTETHAVRSMMQTVANTIRKLQPAHVVFAMDGGHNLRSQLLPSYKAHRKPEDPLLTAQKKLAEDALYVAGFDMMRIEDWEADDVLATLAVTHSDTVIASCDKDLLALTHLATRCRVYHPWGAGEFMDSETKLGIPANHVTDYLALCGDTSDGIPGVIGIGPKTAAQLLTEYDSLEAIIVAAKLGNIKGAAGKKIAEQHQSALLCRRVVELNTRLPIKELHPFQPHPDWRMELQSMRLGSVAAIIESLNGQRFQISNSRSEISDPIHHPERETASATTQQVEPVENGSAGTLGFPADATAIDHRRQEATPPEATGRTTNPTGDTSDVIAAAVTSGAASGDSNYPHDSQQQLWHTAGFTELKESSGIPGTTLK